VRQQSLAAQSGFERYGKRTRREQFLEEMDKVVTVGRVRKRWVPAATIGRGERASADGPGHHAADSFSAAMV